MKSFVSLATLLLISALHFSAVATPSYRPTVTGKLHFSVSDCHRFEGGGSGCSSDSQQSMPFSIDLKPEKNAKNNWTGIYETEFKIPGGGWVLGSVFINSLTTRSSRLNSEYYVVSLNLYGYDSQAQPLFEDSILNSSIEVNELKGVRNASLSTPMFNTGGRLQAVRISVSDLQLQYVE